MGKKEHVGMALVGGTLVPRVFVPLDQRSRYENELAEARGESGSVVRAKKREK